MLVNNAGIYEAVADNAPDDEWHAAWPRTLTINLQAAADLRRLAVSHFLDRGGGGPDRQCRQPRRLSRRFARSTGIMRRRRPAWSAMTQTIARGYAAEGILVLRAWRRASRSPR